MEMPVAVAIAGVDARVAEAEGAATSEAGLVSCAVAHVLVRRRDVAARDQYYTVLVRI